MIFHNCHHAKIHYVGVAQKLREWQGGKSSKFYYMSCLLNLLIVELNQHNLPQRNELFLIWRELGMRFSRPEWRSHEGGKKNFPMNGLAGIVKEYFSMSGEAANGEILFHYDC